MVYVYAKQSNLNKLIGKKLSIQEIEETLKDLGMDLKGEEILNNNDVELKVEITAEKLDMISEIGLARAIKYYLALAKEIPKYKIKKANEKLIVEKSASLTRPKIVSAIVRNVPMTQEVLDEIIKLQEKIHDSFGRNRKKAAIGIYPIENIQFPVIYKSEEPKNIVFRPLESEVKMHGLEILKNHETGKKFAHLLDDFKLFPVLRDSNNQVLSMPPIINSHETGRVEVHHKDLFIECTGFNIQHLDNILKVLISNFIEMGGIAQTVQVEYADGEKYELSLDSNEDEISLNYINNLIGIEVKANEIEKLLNKVMFGLKEINGDKIKIEIPCFKSDVWNDCDIADDIARAYGYNNIVPKFPNVSSMGEHLPFSIFKDKFTESLVSMGYLELYTYILTSTKDQFKLMALNEEKEDFIKISDSAEEGINMTRTMILPENLKSLNINRKNKYPQKVFENGFTLEVNNTQDTKASNIAKLSVSIADLKSNYTQIKSVLDTLLKLNEINFEIKETSLPFLIEGRSAKILVKGKSIGFIGEVHPQILSNFGLIVPVSSFEINLSKLYNLLN
ncbi:MAG: phenylalanine--tRNA ligase subunit beta [Nanoarchaeota archaeon]|nr:phenylalanine--tRNA ligase subunit beta [Nanoarchaeota archaeon]